MTARNSVLIIGFDPRLLDFASPELAPLHLDADKVLAGLEEQTRHLRALGYAPAHCLVDLGGTAEAVLRDCLTKSSFDVVVIGNGIRGNPRYFLLFEKLLNVVHEKAPLARIAFNTRPTDTAEAVQRWL